MLTKWLNELFATRKNVLIHFDELRFYMDNFKPLNDMENGGREKMEEFLKEAHECHLVTSTFLRQIAIVFILTYNLFV